MADVYVISGTLSDTVAEDGDLSAGGLLKVDGAESGTFLGFEQQSLYGTFRLLTGGNWTYQLDNSAAAVQGLQGRTTTTDRFSVSWFAGSGEQVNAIVSVAIDGRNDPAQIAGEAAVSLYGSVSTGASGRLTVIDADNNEKLIVARSGVQGTYGKFWVEGNGDWGYTLNPGVQLPAQPSDDVFSVQSADGTMSTVKVTLSNAGASAVPSTGNDVIVSASANESVNALSGIDIFSLSGNYREYSLAVSSSGGVSVTDSVLSRNGTDTLLGVERLRFADRKMAFDFADGGNAEQAALFIGTIAHGLLSAPNVFGGILNFFDNGSSLPDLFQLAVDVGLITQLAGSDSNFDLARLVFRNVVGSEASPDVANYLASFIQGSGGSMSKATFLATIANLDLNHDHVNLVGLSQSGMEYL